jgi:hypothetical protein
MQALHGAVKVFSRGELDVAVALSVHVRIYHAAKLSHFILQLAPAKGRGQILEHRTVPAAWRRFGWGWFLRTVRLGKLCGDVLVPKPRIVHHVNARLRILLRLKLDEGKSWR